MQNSHQRRKGLERQGGSSPAKVTAGKQKANLSIRAAILVRSTPSKHKHVLFNCLCCSTASADQVGVCLPTNFLPHYLWELLHTLLRTTANGSVSCSAAPRTVHKAACSSTTKQVPEQQDLQSRNKGTHCTEQHSKTSLPGRDVACI